MTRKLLIAITLSFFAAPAAQACDFCEQQVTLSEGLAECYLTLYEDEIGKMKESGLPAQLINLAICDGIVGITRGSASVPGPTSSQKEITQSFLLDEDGLVCLAQDLRAVEWASANNGTVRTFEVTRDCEKG